VLGIEHTRTTMSFSPLSSPIARFYSSTHGRTSLSLSATSSSSSKRHFSQEREANRPKISLSVAKRVLRTRRQEKSYKNRSWWDYLDLNTRQGFTTWLLIVWLISYAHHYITSVVAQEYGDQLGEFLLEKRREYAEVTKNMEGLQRVWNEMVEDEEQQKEEEGKKAEAGEKMDKEQKEN